MDRAGISKIVVHDDSETAIAAYNRYPERILPFVRIHKPEELKARIELNNALSTGRFYGVGEVHLRHWLRQSGKEAGRGSDLPADSESMKKILDLAARHSVPVAVHLDNDYSGELEGLLVHNRKGIVIWSHVGTTPMRMTDPGMVKEMLDRNPNLYADLSAVSPFYKRSSLLDTNGNLDGRWKELFESYPDRFFFGIDVFLEEHLTAVENEAQYWRKVLGQLRPETARKIGCSNIEKIILKVDTKS
jgi:predicted TIM-barrel fold metal-dependent hydrolase